MKAVAITKDGEITAVSPCVSIGREPLARVMRESPNAHTSEGYEYSLPSMRSGDMNVTVLGCERCER